MHPKRIIISAPRSPYYIRMAEAYCAQANAEVVGWVGRGIHTDPTTANLEGGPEVPFALNRWHAITLEQDGHFYGSPHDYDLRDVTTEEYFIFNKILDRYDQRGYFTFAERHHLIFRQLSFWRDLVTRKKADAIYFSGKPHASYTMALYIVGRQLGLQMAMHYPSQFTGYAYLTRGLDGEPVRIPEELSVASVPEFDVRSVMIEPYKIQQTEAYQYLKDQFKVEADSKRLSQKIKTSLRLLKNPIKTGNILSKSSQKFRIIKSYNGTYRTRFTTLLEEAVEKQISRLYKRSLKKEYDSYTSTPPESNFYYFPLQYQPEATTVPKAMRFGDQQLAVDIIASKLPSGVMLVVKEHPSQFLYNNQGERGRQKGFWEIMSRHKNLSFAPIDFPSKELIKRSLGVMSITGTVVWEGIVNQKTAFSFGRNWYSGFRHLGEINEVRFNPVDPSEIPSDQYEKDVLDFAKDVSKTFFTQGTDEDGPGAYARRLLVAWAPEGRV